MAVHRILHIGDTHLAPGPRQSDRLAALDQILVHATDRADEETLAAIIWPGDLYHGQSTIEDRNSLVDRLQKFAHLAPVVICSGNHDREGDLELLSKIRGNYPITVATRPGLVPVSAATEIELALYVLPYPHKSALVAAGVEHQELGGEALQVLDRIIRVAGDELSAADARGELTMLMAHINVAGSFSSVGQPQIGREIELPPATLALLPPHVAVAGNHIHKHQQVGRLVYAGSICRMDYGEQEAKGFVEWTFEDRAFTWRFVPLVTALQLHVEGTLTRDAFTVETINGELADARFDWSGADVRCRYHFKKAEVAALDHAKVHAEFAGCRSLKLDPIAELTHTVRAPQVATATTLVGKVIECAKVQGITLTAGITAKVVALQNTDGEEILRRVHTQTAAEQPALMGGRS